MNLPNGVFVVVLGAAEVGGEVATAGFELAGWSEIVHT